MRQVNLPINRMSETSKNWVLDWCQELLIPPKKKRPTYFMDAPPSRGISFLRSFKTIFCSWEENFKTWKLIEIFALKKN